MLDRNGRANPPSISRSSDCAISKRLSPSATLKVLSWPSLSMKVTLSLHITQLDAAYCKYHVLVPCVAVLTLHPALVASNGHASQQTRWRIFVDLENGYSDICEVDLFQ